MLWCLPFKTHLSCLNRRSQIMFDILVLPFSLGHNALELAAKLKPILIDEIECRTQLLNQGWCKGYTCLHCTAHLSYLQKKPYGFFQPVLLGGRNFMRMQKQKCRNPYELLARVKLPQTSMENRSMCLLVTPHLLYTLHLLHSLVLLKIECTI